MNFMYHDAAPPVYEHVPSNDGIVHIRVPDKTLEKASKSRLSRRNRALLAVAAKRGEVEFGKWSNADLAKLFGASPRSISKASRLSSKELQDVANERRPLFQRAVPVSLPGAFRPRHCHGADIQRAWLQGHRGPVQGQASSVSGGNECKRRGCMNKAKQPTPARWWSPPFSESRDPHVRHAFAEFVARRGNTPYTLTEAIMYLERRIPQRSSSNSSGDGLGPLGPGLRRFMREMRA
jgi:hypothetical protein